MNAEAAARRADASRQPILARFHGVASARPWRPALSSAACWCATARCGSRRAGRHQLSRRGGNRRVASGRSSGARWRRAEAPSGRVVTRSLVVLGLVVGVSIACETAALAWSRAAVREAPVARRLRRPRRRVLFAAVRRCCGSTPTAAGPPRRPRADGAVVAVAAAGLALVALPFGFAGRRAGLCHGRRRHRRHRALRLRARRRAAGRFGGPRRFPPSSFFGLFPRAPAPLLTGFVADAFSLSGRLLRPRRLHARRR